MREFHLPVWLGAAPVWRGLVLAILFFIESVARTILLTVVPLQAFRILGDAQRVSLLYFAAGLVGLAGSLTIPWLVRRLRRRRVFNLGALAMALAAALFTRGDAIGLAAGWDRRAPQHRPTPGPRIGNRGQRTNAAAGSGRRARASATIRWGTASRGKKTPDVIAAIEELMKHDVAGDPITGVRWTRRTTEKISRELASLGIYVCPRTVARILEDLDYTLRVNHKRVSQGSGPDRNEQFKYIAEQRTSFAGRALPIVSIDSKKRELVGNFKNNGTAWRRTPDLVRDHDFRSDAKGIAIPYGVYDLCANRSTLFVGTSHDTPAFAADTPVPLWESASRAPVARARR